MQKMSKLESKLSNIEVSEAPSLTNAIQSAINAVLHSNRFCSLGEKRVDEAVSDACWDLCDGVSRKSMIK